MLWLFQMRSGFISRHRGLSGPPPAAPIRFVRQLHPGMLCSVSSLRTFPASFRGLHCIQPLLLDGDVSCEGIHVVTLSLAGGPSHTSTVGLIDQTHWVCRDGGGIRVRWVCRCRWQGLECSPEEGESGPSPHCGEDPSWRRRDGGGADQVLVARAALAGGLFIPKATWTRAGELTR